VLGLAEVVFRNARLNFVSLVFNFQLFLALPFAGKRLKEKTTSRVLPRTSYR
jgi:hypothetical protein